MTFQSIDEIFTFLEQTRSKLVSRVEGLSDEIATRKPSPEKWSIAEIVEHLSLIDAAIVVLVKRLLEKSAPKKMLSDKPFPTVSYIEKARSVQGKKLSAPEYAVPRENLSLSESLARLEHSRREFLSLRTSLENVDLTSAKFPHPFFGAMDLAHWTAFPAIHELHHLAQIEAVLSEYK